MTITLTETATGSLLDHLHASHGWQHQISIGLNADSPIAIFRRVEGPFAGYTLNVPMHDDDPAWSAEAAEVAAGVEQGRMPACGLNGDVIIRAIDAISAICGESRTGAATLGETVALLAVIDPWYTADPDTRQVLRAVCNGRPLEALSEQSVKVLQVLTVNLAALILADLIA